MSARFASVFTTGPWGPVVFVLGSALLGFAPLLRGGNRFVALMVLECLALALLWALAARWWLPQGGSGSARPPTSSGTEEALQSASRPGPALVLLALLPLALGGVHLLPLSPGTWSALPGRADYAPVLAAVQAAPELWRPLSLVPDATLNSLLVGLPAAAALLLAATCSWQQVGAFLRLLAAMAVFQAVFGILQFGLLRELYFGQGPGRIIGTYANPNHLATFFGMTLPITVILLRESLVGYSVREGRRRRRHARGSRSQLVSVLWGAALFLGLAALLGTVSRGGVPSAVLAVAAVAILLPLRRPRGKPLAWWVRPAAVAAMLALVLSAVGYEAFFARLGEVSSDKARPLMFQTTWEAAMTFWPAGSGLGTFARLYPRFQPDAIGSYLVEYAHSEPLQWLMETGLAGVLAVLWVVLWLLWRCVRIARALQAHPSDLAAAQQATCVLGLLAVALHSVVEFTLHMPANAIVAAFLLGVVLRPLPQPLARLPQTPPQG